MGTINATWHKANKLPDYLKKFRGKMTQDEIRKLWREAHAKACNCR